MKCVIQRVRKASVDVDGDRIAEIGAGLLVLGGIEKGDTEATMSAIRLARGFTGRARILSGAFRSRSGFQSRPRRGRHRHRR